MKNLRQLFNLIFLVVFATSYGQGLTKLQNTIKDATTTKKSDYHIVFTETTDTSKKAGYWAVVEVYINNERKGTFRGSTFPNPSPTANRPKDWVYTIVMSKEDMRKSISEDRYFKWKREKRANKIDDCLRFNQNGKVPAINISSERYKEDMDSWDKFQYKLIYELLNKQGTQDFSFPYHYATTILIHKGYSDYSKGSAGCLTIHPKDQKKFFDLIPMGSIGTCEVIR